MIAILWYTPSPEHWELSLIMDFGSRQTATHSLVFSCQIFFNFFIVHFLHCKQNTLLAFPCFSLTEFHHFLVRVTTCSIIWSIIDTVGWNSQPPPFQRIPASPHLHPPQLLTRCFDNYLSVHKDQLSNIQLILKAFPISRSREPKILNTLAASNNVELYNNVSSLCFLVYKWQ